MMQHKPFYSLNKESYKPISHGRSFLHEQYEAINSFIELNFDEKFHGLIAKPIKSGEHVNWYNENLSGKIQKLEKFKDQKQEELKKKYNAIVHQINLQCERFENSNDENNKAWAESIREVFDINRNMVFSNGEDITIIWGYEFKERGKYYLPLEAFAPLLIDPSDSPEIEEPRIPEDVIEEEIINEPSDETETEQNLHNETIEEKPQTKKKIPKPVKSTHWFLLMLNSIERFTKKYWYILLIIFLFLLLWFLLRDCSVGASDEQKNTGRSEAEKKVRLKEILPPNNRERIIPIDTTKIVEDENGGRVVSNILNMAIADENISFSDFAIDLKDLYPSKDYIITYKDTETSRLVFQFPDGQKDSVKSNVKSKFSKYDPLIWEEELFAMSKRFNDPEFRDYDKRYHINHTRADKAWDITTGDTSVVIAIIDNAFDLKHKEIKSNLRKGRNTARRIWDIFASRSDASVHGTHVAGIALGKANNNFGLCGIAPDCSFMPIQASNDDNSFFSTDIIDGVLYAINHGADVINMSLGMGFRDPRGNLLIDPINSESELNELKNTFKTDQAEFWDLLFKKANEKNIFVVIAAGNDMIPTGVDPKSRSKLALKVCATDINLKRADFSNYCIELNIGKDFISAPGDEIFSASRNNKFKFESGTSMASPLVAGAIGLIKSVNNELTNGQIMDILKKTSLPLSDPKMPGLIQIDKALLEAKKLKN